MKKYYLFAYRTVYLREEEGTIYNSLIDCHPFTYMMDMAKKGECLTFVSAIRISRRQYKRFLKEGEEEYPDWWLLD